MSPRMNAVQYTVHGDHSEFAAVNEENLVHAPDSEFE